MKKTTRTARKVLSVFLAILMMLTTWAVAVPGIVLAADGNKYYVKVYVNIYDGSDGYGGTYNVNSTTGKPDNYSWATNDGWYGRINMTGFTVFGEKGDYDAQDVSAALLEAEKLNTYYAMSGLSNDNKDGDWDSKAIAKAEYTFVLDSFPVEIFWMNDENNWDGGNTGFAIRKLTVATSENGTEHTMWEGLAGSDSETYNYYGSITPTGIHTCFEDYAKNYDMNDYKFYKAITTSSQRAWTDPYTYGSAGTYYLNEYANGGVSATFSEGTTSVASTVDYIDTSSTDTYYVNYTNHSKTQIAEITGTYNDGNFVSSPYGIKLNPGETRSFEINKSNYSKLAKYNNAANFTFEYTLSNVYASDEVNASLAKFIQPTYIGLWNESSYSKSGTTFSLNNIGDLQVTFQTTEGILETVSTPSGEVDHASVEYRYYIDNSVANNSWEKTGLRFYITETNNSRVHFQNKNKTAGTMRFSGPITNTSTASLKMADFAFNSVTENFVYNVSATATYNKTVTPTWEPKTSDSYATFWNDNPAWVRFGGTTFDIDPSADNQYATILLSDMLFNDYGNYQAKFSASIDVYAVNKAELRKYVRETLLDFAPMSLRYNTTAFENYQNKLASAMNVLADQKTTQKAVTNALAELKSAVEALQTTDNLINQVDKLTHIQYVDDIGSEVAASTAERYVLVPLDEHAVPQKTEYIGNGAYKNVTNKNSDLKTNHSETDTDINIINYRYWNIDYSEINPTIEALDIAIAEVEADLNSNNPTYKSSYKSNLENIKADLEAMNLTIDVVNTPTSQEDVQTLIDSATSLISHKSNDVRSSEDKHYSNCVYDGNDDNTEDDIFDQKANSCVEGGYYKATCILCGKVATVVETPPTGHDCDYSTKPYNDEATGKHYWVCASCGENEYFDHNWNEGVETTAPGCGTEGVMTYTCNDCGATKTEAIEAGEHNFAVTDNGDGTHISKCTKCGANEPDATAEAHTYTYKNNNDGTHTATCSVCKATETVAHIFANPVLARPTLVDGAWVDGTYTYTCVCGGKKVEPAERADYSALDEVVEALEALKDNEKLTDDAKAAITAAIAKADNLADDLVTAEQKDIDDLVKELQKVKADADEAIKNKELGVEKITEATSGVKVQFIDKSGLGIIDSIQLGKDNGFIIRVANGNADSDITITKLNGADKNVTVAPGESADFDIDATGLTAGLATYTITYTIDGLKDADGNLIEFTTEAYLYVKEEAVVPHHYFHEKVSAGDENSAWDYYIESDIGDFSVVYNYKAPYDEFGNKNLIQDGAGLFDYVRDQYDYENDGCYAGCSDKEWKKGDAHAATYAFYIDTSLAQTWQDARLRARIVENESGFYHNAALKYIRLANNQEYLDYITSADKTFSATLVPSSSGTQGASWKATSNGDMTVSEYTNDNENEYVFGYHHPNEGCEETTAYIYISGAIPTPSPSKVENAKTVKMMLSPRLEFNGPNIAFAEAVTMTTHLYITSYDKAELRGAVASAEQAGFNSAYFDADKYEAYESALKNAKEVLGKAETNQNEIDEAIELLKNAIAELTKAENEAMFVLTVTHSIYEGKEKSGDATETEYDYYLVNGAITPAQIDLTDRQINKKDDIANLNVTADAEHTYNYWYINYAGAQEALEKADEIIKDTTTGYSDEYKAAVEAAKDALENSKEATDSPALQGDADSLLEALTDLTGHTCADVTTDKDHNCDTCGKADVTKHDYANPVLTRPTYNEETGEWNDGYYTSTCNCGATSTTEIERAKYEAYDKAVADLNALLAKDNLTDAAKAEINKVLADNDIDDNLIKTAEEQKIVDDAAAALKAEIEKLTDDEGKLKDEFKKPDSTAAEKAVESVEALEDKIEMPQADKDAIENLRDTLDDILDEIVADDNATAEEYQDRLDAVEEAAKEILEKYKECTEGHAWGKPELARPTLVDGTYTYTCANCGTTKTETAERAIYEAYDKAVADLNALLADDTLTDAAKAEINKVLADNDIDDNLVTAEQKTVDDAAAALNVVLDKIANDTTGAYEKVDYTKYNAAIGAYKALDKTMTEADKEAVEKIIAEIEKIPDDGSKKDYQAQVDKAADDIAKINAKYCDCAKGDHTWGDPVLTTPPAADAQGEYTETCGICGATQITKVARADYSEFNTVVGQLNDLSKNENLTDAAKVAITEALADAEALNKNLPADATTADDKLIEGGQDEIDALVNELKGVVADTNAAIANGSALKPDYKAWEEAEGKYDALTEEQLKNVKADIIAEANKLKEDIDKLQNTEGLTQATATQKDINDATARLNEIIAGITDGSLKNPADFTEVNKDLADAKEKADKNDVVDGVKEDIQEIEDKLNEIKNDPTTNADDQDEINALEKELEEIITGITDGSLVKPDYEKWEEAETAYDALDKTNVKADIITEANGLKDTIAGKQADKTLTQATATQKDINDATARLNEIIAGITDGSLKNPADFTEVNKDLADAKDKAEKNDVVDSVKENIKDIEEKLEKLEDANADKQGEINALEKELEEIIAGIENGSLVKPDYTNYNKAVDAYKALDDVMSDEDKAAVEAIKAEIAEIPADGTKAQYQAQIDKAAEDIAAINAKYGDCANGNHKNNNNDHNCDVCGTKLSDCADSNNDHNCDVCSTKLSDCADSNNDHKCDTCDTKLSDCADNNNDHNCDVCGAKVSDCADSNNDHNCDICDTKLSDCADNNNDHNCDVCGTKVSDCADSNNDHKCDTCDTKLSDCADVTTDNDHSCDICGKANVTEHNYANPVLTRPIKNEDGTWNDGYYTSTCNCGGTSTTEAKRADYEAYDEAKAALEVLLKDTTITDAAKTEINKVLAGNKIADNYIATAEEQKIVTDAAAALKTVLDKLTNDEGKLEDGYKKPDYTDWNKAEDAYGKLDKTNVSDKLIDEVTELKNTINALKADPTANAAQDQKTIDDATDRLNAIIAEINAALTEKPDFNGYDDAHDEYEDLVEQYGDKIKDGVAADVADLDEIVDGVRTDENATKINDQSTINGAKANLEKIIAGIKDGSLRDPDYSAAESDLAEAKGKADKNDVIDGVKEEIAEIENALNELKNSDKTTAKEHQDDVDALEDRLEKIIAGINDGSLVKPDYEAAEDAIKNAEAIADKLSDAEKKALEELKKQLDEIKNNPASNKKDNQDDVDSIKEAAAGIVGKYAECLNGHHTWAKPAYIRDSVQYAEICIICGETVFTDAELADYDEFYSVENQLKELAKTENLTDAAAKAIADALVKADELDKRYPADLDKTNGSGISVEGGQKVIDRVVDELKEVVADINAKIADGSAFKPDFSAYEAEVKIYKEETSTVVVSQEDKNAVAEAVKIVEAIKADANATAKDNAKIAEQTAIIKAVNNKYSACVKNGHMETIIPGKDPTCSSTGLTEGKKCVVCGAVTEAQQEIPTLAHTDADGDGTCDVCGRNGLYDGCVCLCHNNNWFWRIVYMIIRLIWKIFKMHPVCACGAVHY